MFLQFADGWPDELRLDPQPVADQFSLGSCLHRHVRGDDSSVVVPSAKGQSSSGILMISASRWGEDQISIDRPLIDDPEWLFAQYRAHFGRAIYAFFATGADDQVVFARFGWGAMR